MLDRRTLPPEVQQRIADYLGQNPDDLTSDQMGFLAARREYLTDEEVLKFNLMSKPEKVSKAESVDPEPSAEGSEPIDEEESEKQESDSVEGDSEPEEEKKRPGRPRKE